MEMNNCFGELDLEQIGNSMVEDFRRRISKIPPDMCGPFHAEAQQLETQLLMVYKIIARVSRNQEDLTQIAKLWASMVLMCDASAKHLGELVRQHPNCGAETYYDRVLDLRNKCQRLQKMHA